MAGYTMYSYDKMVKPVTFKGLFGGQEVFDSLEVFQQKTSLLLDAFLEKKHIVFLTGAGISTVCGLPDFRGYHGIWAEEARGRAVHGIAIQDAEPSYTHKFLVKFDERENIEGLITLNVDDLHRKSGFPSHKQLDFDGNLRKEQCNMCKRINYRDEVIPSVGYKETGRLCERNEKGRPCRGKFVDVSIDWNMNYRPDFVKRYHEMLKSADLLVCIGVSFRQEPTSKILEDFEGPIFSINVQETPIDNQIYCAIHAKCDDVFRVIVDKLEMYIEENPVADDGMVEVKMEVDDE